MKKITLLLFLLGFLTAPLLRAQTQNCLTFDGTDDYVDCADTTGLNGHNKFTVEAWIKISVLGKVHGIVAKRTTIGNDGWSLFVNTDNKIYFKVNNEGNTFAYSTALVINRWYHVAAIFDGSQAAASRKKLYIDGVLVNTGTSTFTKVNNTTGHMQIGTLALNAGSWFKGQIDEVRFYKDVALTASQIDADVYRELTNATVPQAYYQFNAASGAIVTDVSGHNHTGTATGDFLSTSWGASTAPIPYYSIAASNWNVNTTWAAGQNAPTATFARVKTLHNIPVTATTTVEELTVAANTLTVNAGVVLTVNSTLTNSATITDNGSIVSSGSLTNNSGGNISIAASKSLSTVTSSNSGSISNSGTLTSSGTFTNNATGALTNNAGGSVSSSTLNNAGNVTNAGTITNNVTIGNTGTFNNSNVLTNIGTLTSSVNLNNTGTITTSNLTASPVSSGLTWGGTVNYNGASAQTIASGTYNNLTVGSTGGGTANGNLAVNGILNLTGANASATKGRLEMVTAWNGYPTLNNLSSYTLTMGSSSSTAGTGDVTGIVKRTSIVANTAYSYGNQYTIFSFTPGVSPVMPSDLTVTIKIGAAPAGKPSAIQRSFEIVPASNGANCTLAASFHYLDSELNGNTETKLVTWDYDLGGGQSGPDEHGRSSYDYSNNFIGFSNLPVTYFINSFRTIFTLGDNIVEHHVWNGSVSSNWYTDSNWVNGQLPGPDDYVDIPGSSSYTHELTLTSGQSVTVNTFSIAATGKINMGNATITVANLSSGGWQDDSGLSDAGTSTVIFANPGATVSGIPNFYNVQINNGADLTLQGSSTMKIAGALTRVGTGKFYADVLDGTVEYNGAAQTVVLPDALPHYHNLILSGSGLKTLPNSALTIHNNLTLQGTASAAPTATLNIGGSLTLGSGTTFTAGSLTHNIGGNFVNNGATFSSASSTFNFNGSLPQSVGGTTEPSAFNNFSVASPADVTLLNNTTTNALAIGSGSHLNVTAGKTLTPSGTTSLGSAGCLVLKSDASGTASFIDNGTVSGSGSAKIERYLTPYDVVSDLKFHFISSPVGSQQAIEPEFIDFASSDITDFYKWDEPSNQWINFRSSDYTVRNESFGDGFNFVAGKGFMVAYPNAVTKNFIGTPFTGNLVVNCTAASNAWNLVGNPYPSSVDWDLVTKGSGMDNALYYYDNAAPGYAYYIPLTGPLGTASKYIAPMQGVMAHAKLSGTHTLTFSNAARTHVGANVFYKDAPLTSNVLDLKLKGNSTTDYARVCFYNQATANYDGDFDAFKLLSSSSTASELYSLSADSKLLSINTLPMDVMEGGSVPVSFKVGKDGEYKISADKINSFDASTYITLEDKLTRTLQKLNDNPVYTFAASVQDASDRFVLHFKNATLVPGPSAKENTHIYASNGNIVVSSQSTANAQISVSNMLGQEVLAGSTNGNAITTLNASNLTNGVYIVNLKGANNMFSQKVVINK